jgi:hypothetical protein
MAIGGRTAAYGGAVRVRGSSSLRSVRSTLSRNVADGGSTTSFYVIAGAVCIDGDSVGEFSESEIVENIARAGLCCPSGGAFYIFDGSRLVLATSKINRNVAEGGVYGPSGGAIAFYANSASEIAGCELLENIVRGGGYAGAGSRPHRERQRQRERERDGEGEGEGEGEIAAHTAGCKVNGAIGALRPLFVRCRKPLGVQTHDEPLVGRPEQS